jgi:small subunit ribosomal protein S20
MANTKSAEKRAREAIERRGRNVAHRSKVRSAVRRVVTAIQAGNKAEAAAALKAAAPVIDAMARKGIIHRNKAARHKSRLAAQVKALAAK